MTIQITTIDKVVLLEMHKILSSSSGYDISIQDELDYFDPNQAINWFLATNQSNDHVINNLLIEQGFSHKKQIF